IIRIVISFCASVTIATACFTVHADPISFEGREMLLDVSADEKTVAPPDLTFTLANADLTSLETYALLLQGDFNPENWRIYLNDLPFTMSPVRRDEGLIFSIPPGSLKETNTLRLERLRHEKTPAPGIRIFSLRDT